MEEIVAKPGDIGKKSRKFYKEALRILLESKVPFLIGGAFALYKYSGIFRDTKDLDIFCRTHECNEIIKTFIKHGYRAEVTDARWIAKIFKDDYFIDVIFDSTNNICTVDKTWIKFAKPGKLYGHNVKFLAPEELIWCKIYIHSRDRYDAADINHIIFGYGEKIDWKRLLDRMNPHWQLLLAQILHFQFVYPSERDKVPQWLVEELLTREKNEYDFPASTDKVCRGPLIDQVQYTTDIKKWGLKSITSKTI